MMNQVSVIGRIVKDLEVKKLENGKEVSNITLAVPRSYKNEKGIYETDFIDVTLWGNIANSTAEYCKSGDLVGVKGRLETSTYEKDGKKNKSYNIVCERVTFLSSKTHEKNDEDLEV